MTIETDLANDLEYQVSRLKFWAENKAHFQPIVDVFEEWSASLRITSYSLDICLTGDKEKFLQAYRLLRAHGYEPDKEYPEVFAEFSCFWRCEGKPDIWFAFSSTVCKMVQVRTEMVEKPVYEVRCDG